MIKLWNRFRAWLYCKEGHSVGAVRTFGAGQPLWFECVNCGANELDNQLSEKKLKEGRKALREGRT